MTLKYWESPGEFYKDKDIRDAWLECPEGELPLLRFHSLDALDWVDAAFTTRRGGVSTGTIGELNLGFGRGDVPQNVERNFRRVMARMHAPFAGLALTQQVHGDVLQYVDESLTVGEEFVRKVFETDGLYTDIPDIMLSATFADCVPVLLADPARHQVAAVHSGWKGTVLKIAGKAVRALEGRGGDPASMTAVIGPCISGPRYEVTGEVIEALRSAFGEAAMEDIAVQTDETHWLCDLPAAVWYALREAGVPAGQIHFAGLCSYDNADELFSHRRSGGKRGNMNSFIRIRG